MQYGSTKFDDIVKQINQEVLNVCSEEICTGNCRYVSEIFWIL